jgi:hypothetical protein
LRGAIDHDFGPSRILKKSYWLSLEANLTRLLVSYLLSSFFALWLKAAVFRFMAKSRGFFSFYGQKPRFFRFMAKSRGVFVLWPKAAAFLAF